MGCMVYVFGRCESVRGYLGGYSSASPSLACRFRAETADFLTKLTTLITVRMRIIVCLVTP